MCEAPIPPSEELLQRYGVQFVEGKAIVSK